MISDSDRSELLASIPRERGTCWFCKHKVDWSDLIAGYDTWDEQRLVCSNCDRRMRGEPDPLYVQEGRGPTQAWYWTPEWQAGERAADADIAAGRTRTFDNAGDLLAWLAPGPRFHARHVVFVALIGFLLGVVIRGMVG